MACLFYQAYMRRGDWTELPNQPNPLHSPESIGIKAGFHSGLNELWPFAPGKKPEVPRNLDFTDRCFIDSGAFSAFTRGKKIDLGEYAEYVKEIVPKLGSRPVTIANLDDITDPEQSLKNWHELKKRGVDTLPVYHVGEPVHYLDAYASETDYVGYGGVASDGTARALCDIVQKFRRHPGLKWHGFGITRRSLLLAVPWYSVDSTALANIASRLHGVHVGNRTYLLPNREAMGSNFVMPGTEQWKTLQEFCARYGRDLERACVRDQPGFRQRYLISYDDMAETLLRVPTEIPDNYFTSTLL